MTQSDWWLPAWLTDWPMLWDLLLLVCVNCCSLIFWFKSTLNSIYSKTYLLTVKKRISFRLKWIFQIKVISTKTKSFFITKSFHITDSIWTVYFLKFTNVLNLNSVEFQIIKLTLNLFWNSFMFFPKCWVFQFCGAVLMA